MQARITKFFGTLTLAIGLAAIAPSQEPQVGGEPQEGGVNSTTQQGDRSSRLTLRLRDRLLRDVIQSIRRQAGVNIVIDQSIEDRVTIDLDDVEWRRALELIAEAAGCVVLESAGGIIKVEKPARVFFSFENVDVQRVIDAIAKISGANIVVGPEVQGTVTVRLRNIPWRDALEATAKTLGYVVVEEERGILRVVPPSNMVQDLVSREFQLRYVRPPSAYMPFLQSEYVQYIFARQQLDPRQNNFTLIDALQSLITPEVGSLQYHAEQNVIFVKDTKLVVEQIARIIEKIDVEPAQVFIDVQFVTTSDSDVLDVGVSPGSDGWTASIGLGQIPHRLPFNLGAGGWDDNLIANDTGTGPFADLDNNPTGRTTMPDVVFGALNFQQVTAALRLLKRDTSSEIAQAPKLIALDHQMATIFVGETIRYAQARSEQGQAGGLQLVVEEAPNSPVSVGFQLLVIPHVVPGTDKVVMDVIPKADSLSGAGSASTLAPAGFDVFTVGAGQGEGTIALPRISSSTIATKVLLRSGQTAVLGGLVTDSDTVTETRLPFVGDIPVLGWLFKNRVESRSKRTLIVFIRPDIIRSPEQVEETRNEILRQRAEALQRAEFEAMGGIRR
jgi:type IV pilus assembly protein PilQ